MTDTPFRQRLYTTFTQMFWTAGISLGIEELEALRHRVNEIANVLEAGAHDKAVETTELLQAAVDKGFLGCEKDIEELLGTVTGNRAYFEKQIKDLKTENREARKLIGSLQKTVERIGENLDKIGSDE